MRLNQAYQLGANSFLVKPVDFERFVEISQALAGYWMWMNQAPDLDRPAPNLSRDHSEPFRSKGPPGFGKAA